MSCPINGAEFQRYWLAPCGNDFYLESDLELPWTVLEAQTFSWTHIWPCDGGFPDCPQQRDAEDEKGEFGHHLPPLSPGQRRGWQQGRGDESYPNRALWGHVLLFIASYICLYPWLSPGTSSPGLKMPFGILPSTGQLMTNFPVFFIWTYFHVTFICESYSYGM